MFSRYSDYIQKAIKKIAAVAGKSLTEEEREAQTVFLAQDLLHASLQTSTRKEKKRQKELAAMMEDPAGKAFTVAMSDRCFRSSVPEKIADECRYLLDTFGIPRYLSLYKQRQLAIFRKVAGSFCKIAVPFLIRAVRKETASVILPGEKNAFLSHIRRRKLEGVRLNINHLGEAILGEKEALRRLEVYLQDLRSEEVEYISVKISTLFSQIHLLAREETLSILSDRLAILYRAAIKHPYVNKKGEKTAKFVNLDMEEYRDLELTKSLFLRVLSSPEFFYYSGGIVLQAYLPDCFPILQEITEWARKRVAKGGSPVKVRIVKGANLAMERFEASVKGWSQAPYRTKEETDANYKKMVSFACQKENAEAVRVGIASHNLFDIAYAMILRSECGTEEYVDFEMLEGMADATRRVVQAVAGDVLLYCPVATREDFACAVAYLIRRLDENTGPDNFLRSCFGLHAHSPKWQEETDRFLQACKRKDSIAIGPRRMQDVERFLGKHPIGDPFSNEPDTDFALPGNRARIADMLSRWKETKHGVIPCVIGGKELAFEETAEGFDPSSPDTVLYRYSLASLEAADMALATAEEERGSFGALPLEERLELLASAAATLRSRREDLIGVMVADGGKSVSEADAEVSEAIDFAEYYLRSARELLSHKDMRIEPRGTILITPPWNFPVAIPAGGIFAALATGNTVIFKPAPEAVLSGFVLARALWDAGISQKTLQFLSCADDPVGSYLISDSRVSAVILTGATETARLFLRIRNNLPLFAETGGKNGIIVTSLADRDLVVKDIITSAFGHSGQKCSAASLVVLEKEVYDDPKFFEQLKDAAESLFVGSAWNLASKVTPLIRDPGPDLLRALTTLDPGEAWLVEPKQDPNSSNLWSPGIKIGVVSGSFFHKTECFGPVLGIMRAENLDHAIDLVNQTPYGLTSGLHSLDEREIRKWIRSIEAGNLYINRTITGAVVQRQPFGGCKASGFGFGMKAGGPNYLLQFVTLSSEKIPSEGEPVSGDVAKLLDAFCNEGLLSGQELGKAYGNLRSYTLWASKFSGLYDPDTREGLTDKIIGQDNALGYVPRKGVGIRIEKEDSPCDVLSLLGGALLAGIDCDISFPSGLYSFLRSRQQDFPTLHFLWEETEEVSERIRSGRWNRLRLISSPSSDLFAAAALSGCFIDFGAPWGNGRFEMLRYLREVSVSYDYHRYGNLGNREEEERNPVL